MAELQPSVTSQSTQNIATGSANLRAEADRQARLDTEAKRLKAQAIEAEKAVLGSMLLSKEAVPRAMTYLSDESFFDEWFKTHSHLFEEYESHIKLYSGKKTPNTILVEIPANYNVHKIQREIGSIVSEKINKSNAKFDL